MAQAGSADPPNMAATADVDFAAKLALPQPARFACGTHDIGPQRDCLGGEFNA
jgi:hypothetical protein